MPIAHWPCIAQVPPLRYAMFYAKYNQASLGVYKAKEEMERLPNYN
jgi:hypothetical protein